VFQAPLSRKRAYLFRLATAPLREIQRRLDVAKLPALNKRVRAACLKAEHEYRPQPFAGRLILFRSNHKPLGQVTDPRAGWSDYARLGLEIREVEGNHENILLEPQVRSVAEGLRMCLDHAPVAQPRTAARTAAGERARS
jgi:thioesterase domain-containing protein